MNLKELIFGGGVTGVSDRGGAYAGSIQAWLPVKDILQGVVLTRDKRFIKIMELLPVNFYTMSEMEKGSAIADLAAYLKIAPANLQINVLTQKFDLNSYIKMLRAALEREGNERCREMIEESMSYVPQLVEREAITHRFFLSFSYDPSMKAADNTPGAIAALLNEKAEVARRYLDRCGVTVLEPEYADNAILELLYQLVNKHTSQHTLIEVVADDPDTLEQRLTSVETLCVASDMLAKRCEFKHEQAFLSFLPLLMTDPDIERKSRRNALTQGIAGAFPFASYELSDAGDIFLGLNLYNRSPAFMDFFDDYKYTNGNFAAFGSSGAGKSTMLQCIAKRLREQGRKIICVVPEKGHECRPLCEAVGGQFIKLGPSSPDCIGLMEIRRLGANAYSAHTGEVRRESLLAEKVSWLSVWYSLQKRGLTEEDRSYIDASLIECYGRFGITFNNASLFLEDGVTLKETPVIKDWYDVLMEKPETKHLAVVLTRYVSGSASSMGGRTNVDTDNPYIVIDLTGLSDDLQLAAVYAATGFATDVIVQNGDVGTALLSDELWKLLGANSNPLAADYTMQMVKLIRSQGGIAGVTSQGMADMMALDGGKYGKGILDSCRVKFIMQMEEQEARLVQEKLNLTEEETRMITRFRRGEGLLCIGHNHVPIAIHVSPREYEAITTSPTDLRARLKQDG